uniref:Uncharacterized protein n=1 Tax=Oryza punctata TaxID=4537 RepID=A0A0E0JUL4_ORYPU
MPHHGGGKKKKGRKGKPRKKTDDRGEANVRSGDSSPPVHVDVEVATEVETAAEVDAEAGMEAKVEVGTEAGPQCSGTLASPIPRERRRGFDTVVTLGAWSIWKERNNLVLNNCSRPWSEVAVGMAQEATLWHLAHPLSPTLPFFNVEYREGTFYAGELKSMIYQNNKTFCVYYWHFQGRYAKLGTKISYSYMSISSLQYFVGQKQNRLVEAVQIYDSKPTVVADTTMLGRRLFLGFLMRIIHEHKKGCSWSGNFSLDDLIVKNSSTFEIAKITSAHASPRTMAEDLKRLANILEKYFCTAEGHVPGYFKRLCTDMKQCIGELGLHDVKGHLFLDLYRVHQALGKDEKQDLLSLLTVMFPEEDWGEIAKKQPMLRKVFLYGTAEGTTDKQAASSGTKKKQSAHNTTNTVKRVQYGLHLADLLVFIRHVTEHGPDHTKDDDKEQKLKSLVEVDLIIARYIPDAVIDLIKALVMNDMLNRMFVDPWNTWLNASVGVADAMQPIIRYAHGTAYLRK